MFHLQDGEIRIMKNIKDITVGSREFRVEVVESRTDLMKGLGDKSTMPTGEGMLFLYNRPWYYSFWMKDMKFAIDIIGINKNGQVTEILKNLQPELNVPYRQMKIYNFSTPVQVAIEVNAGDTFGIIRGDTLEILDEGNDGFDKAVY